MSEPSDKALNTGSISEEVRVEKAIRGDAGSKDGSPPKHKNVGVQTTIFPKHKSVFVQTTIPKRVSVRIQTIHQVINPPLNPDRPGSRIRPLAEEKIDYMT